MTKVPMGLMMVDELIRDLVRCKCSYMQIVEAIRVRKPLGEDITEREREMVFEELEQARLSSELLGEK